MGPRCILHIDGDLIRCGGCDEVLFHAPVTIADQVWAGLKDGRVHGESTAFRSTIHLCDFADVERVQTEVSRQVEAILKVAAAPQ